MSIGQEAIENASPLDLDAQLQHGLDGVFSAPKPDWQEVC